MTAPRPLRFAVFGTGYFSTLQIPAWLETGSVELVALYNRTVSKAEKAAQAYGGPRVYGDPEELLCKEELDFVDIITEVPAHAPLVLLAAKHKVPVICQKPMAPDYATCKAMVKACQEAGVAFYIHENFRWQLPMLAVKQALEEDRIGSLIRAHLQFTNGGMGAYERQPFLRILKHRALMDMGSHAFDLARFFFGEPERIYCETYCSDIDGQRIEDVFAATLRIGELICVCGVSPICESRVFIEGTQGSIELRPDNLLHIKVGAEEEVRDTCTWPRYSWCSDADHLAHGGDVIHSIYLCNQNLLRGMRGEAPPETTGEDNLKTTKLVHAAIASSLDRRPVDLSTWGSQPTP